MFNIVEEVRKNNIGEIKENVSFKALTTYKTGGIAKYVVIPSNIENLKKLILMLKENNINFKIFGNGSNILAGDKVYDGVIIKLTEFKESSFENNILTVEAGCNIMKFANCYSKLGYSGLEWACGIPGTIGGAVYMNAGAYKKAISDILLTVDVLDSNMNVITLKNEDLGYSYRKSIFMEKDYIILRATLKLEKSDLAEIMDTITDRKQRRVATQPLEYPSAGSVFRNPDNDFAGRLIEECLLKGMQIGGAMISDKHANFIINKNEATSQDIKDLIDLVQKEVFEKFNVQLKVEQEMFNWE